jgi:hypothetical protein
MIIPLSKKTVSEYIIRADRDSAAPTTFLIAPLSVIQRAQIEDQQAQYFKSTDDAAPKPAFCLAYNQGFAMAVRLGLKGWRNLKDASGAEVPFKESAGVLDEDTLNLLPYEVVQELGAKILSLSSLPEDVAKNS